MENDVIKNRIAPWQARGRWYNIFVESTGSALVLTHSDIKDATVTSTGCLFPKGFKCIDVKVVNHDVVSGKTVASYQTAMTSGTKQYIKLPAVADFTYYDMWVFGYFEAGPSAMTLSGE